MEKLLGSNVEKIEIPEKKLVVLRCGVMDYNIALELQETLLDERKRNQIPDTLILVRHPSVYTVGRGVKDSDLDKHLYGIDASQIVRVNRGGRVTYHDPGQLIGYFITKFPHDVARRAELLDRSEELIIDTLEKSGIMGYSRKGESIPGPNGARKIGMRGVWHRYDEKFDQKKIASIGLEFHTVGREYDSKKVDVSMHGFALNVNTDLTGFSRINPCGLGENVMTSMQILNGIPIPIQKVEQHFVETLRERWEPYVN